MPAASAHPERPSHFPTGDAPVPQLRTSGPSLVVCKADTRERIQSLSGPARERNEALLERCRYRHIQAAVNDAKNGYRILIMPGVYKEEPSRQVPTPDPRCENDYTPSERDPARPIADLGIGSFSRGLYAGSRRDQASDIERRRTGRLLRIGPGDEQPLTVSWRTRPGGEGAERIEYGSGSLPVP